MSVAWLSHRRPILVAPSAKDVEAMAFAARLVHRIDAHDRDLLLRWSLDDEAGTVSRRAWIGITHLGSAWITIGSVLVPLLLRLVPRAVSLRAALALAISHVIVQVVKRFVNRARPERPALIPLPDRFSFPSGHATASLAIALSYALAFPALAVVLTGLGLTVGFSRVVLGVHYPGDVVVGQAIAASTMVGVLLLT
jgi:undecaprenyl-diphosphatase